MWQQRGGRSLSKIDLVITTGGTGGHLYPAQALGKELIAQGFSPLFVGVGLATTPFFDREQFAFYSCKGSALNRLKAPFLIGAGVVQCLALLLKKRPKCVIGFGGYTTFPLLVAAKLLCIPIYLFEPNRIAGKVNRLFAPLAKGCFVPFRAGEIELNCPQHPVIVPIWKSSEQTNLTKEQALQLFGLKPNKKTLLIFGGSAGARVMNELIPQAIGPEFQVIHIGGKGANLPAIKERYKGVDAVVVDYVVPLAKAWIAADFVICRAGALSITEQIAFRIPGILIPYPHSADNHQLANAKWVAQQLDGGFYIEEHAISKEKIQALLKQLVGSNRRFKNLFQPEEKMVEVVKSQLQRSL